MLGKLKGLIDSLYWRVIKYLPIKGMVLRIEGAGASNPTILISYNISTIVRTGVGVYQGTLNQGTFYGLPIIDNSVATVEHDIQPTINTDAFHVNISAISSTVFQLDVCEVVQGTGNKLQYNPYDIVAGDTIGGGLLFNFPDPANEIPPP